MPRMSTDLGCHSKPVFETKLLSILAKSLCSLTKYPRGTLRKITSLRSLLVKCGLKESGACFARIEVRSLATTSFWIVDRNRHHRRLGLK